MANSAMMVRMPAAVPNTYLQATSATAITLPMIHHPRESEGAVTASKTIPKAVISR